MNAMILAAGLGTRLKPWTLEHPKALVPVAGVPMLERVIKKLKSEGFDKIVVNVHHFADQIVEFLDANDFGVEIFVSDESVELLDTGGGIVKAASLLAGAPFLVHNVDIVSNADLRGLMTTHEQMRNDFTLLTSDRSSSRKLMFDGDGKLIGWHNRQLDAYRPESVRTLSGDAGVTEEAFSGIYVVGERGLRGLCDYASTLGRDSFPIMDYLLTLPDDMVITHRHASDLKLLDIGKPEALAKADEILAQIAQ